MKIVIVLDPELPLGLLANAAAALAFSASPAVPDGVGGPVLDAQGGLHPGITRIPLPILACGRAQLSELRRRAVAEGVACVDFCDVAQRARGYEAYAAELARRPEAELSYLGLCLYGDAKAVQRLTGQLPLVR